MLVSITRLIKESSAFLPKYQVENPQTKQSGAVQQQQQQQPVITNLIYTLTLVLDRHMSRGSGGTGGIVVQ